MLTDKQSKFKVKGHLEEEIEALMSETTIVKNDYKTLIVNIS